MKRYRDCGRWLRRLQKLQLRMQTRRNSLPANAGGNECFTL
jgi:hypothetical protein